jgi:hypothetical protein
MSYVPSVNRACEAVPPTDDPRYPTAPLHCPQLVEDRHRILPRASSPLVVFSEIKPGELN